MNLLELRARLRVSVKNPDEGDVPDEVLTSYINSGYLDLAARYDFHQTRKRCTFLTVAGQAKYQLPGDVASVLRLRDNTHGRKIWKKGDRAIAEQHIPKWQWWPRWYVRYRNYVELGPTPNEDGYVIEVYYIAIPAVLAADSDIPVLPLTWHDGVHMRAKWYYYMDKGDSVQQAQSLNNYTVWLSDKPNEIEEESVDIDNGSELPTLGGSRGDWSGRFDDGFFDFRE
jgi:hypothetical protein